MKLGWQLFIVAAAVGTGLFLSKRPWEVYQEQQGKVAATTEEMKQAESERERLMKEKAHYSSPLGKEAAIRDKGYYKPGETPAGP